MSREQAGCDCDLLLAEEFATNPAFADQFKSFTKFAGSLPVG
jgi:hypothetical protein